MIDAVNPRARVVVLVSGAGTTMAAVLSATEHATYPAEVVAVVSDNAAAGGLAFAQAVGVPVQVVDPAGFPDRDTWCAALADAVQAYEPDLVLSAGFMRILMPVFIDRFSPRLLNSHPSLLPAFPGAHAVRDALAYGVRVSGATVHVVDAGVDTGPILAQTAVPVVDGDDEDTLHERIKVAERMMLVEVVGRAAAGRITVEGRKARIT